MDNMNTGSAENIPVIEQDHPAAPRAETATTPTPDRPWASPSMDVLEGPEGLLLVVDVPGVSRDTLSLTVERQALTLEGRWAQPDSGEAVRGGLTPTNYRRLVRLPEGLDLSAITARLDAGVLEIHLPVAAALKPRSIQVQGVQ